MGATPNLGLPYPENTDPLANMAAAIQALASAIDSGSGGAWTAYAVAWTGTVSNPGLGNGALAGRYRQVGKSVQYSIELTFGSTTTLGSGAYVFSLPVPARFGANLAPLGQAYLRDNSAPANAMRYALLITATTIQLLTEAGGSGATNAVPWVWAVGDRIVITGRYEAA